MKKIILYFMLLVVCTLVLTGCSCEKKASNDKITLTCTAEKDELDGMENQTKIIYEFNKDQMATGYTTTTIQKFSNEELYKTYKEAQEKSAKDTSNANIKYELVSDDSNKTLEFKMTVTGLEKLVESEEDKAGLKLSKILESNKALNSTCELKGIKESEVK